MGKGRPGDSLNIFQWQQSEKLVSLGSISHFIHISHVIPPFLFGVLLGLQRLAAPQGLVWFSVAGEVRHQQVKRFGTARLARALVVRWVVSVPAGRSGRKGHLLISTLLFSSPPLCLHLSGCFLLLSHGSVYPAFMPRLSLIFFLMAEEKQMAGFLHSSNCFWINSALGTTCLSQGDGDGKDCRQWD